MRPPPTKGGAGRPRRAAESLARPPPPTPTSTASPWPQYGLSTPRQRDSDVSTTATTVSTAAAVNISDRSYQQSAINAINSYLASQNLKISLRKSPLPSSGDITSIIKHLVHNRLSYPPSSSFEEDVFEVLKFLKCPIQLRKSALKAPGTPHSWPSVLAMIHWLLQLVNYNDYAAANSGSGFESDQQLDYAVKSYMLYIDGNDDEAKEMDEAYLGEMADYRDKLAETLTALEGESQELEAKLERLRSEPSEKDVLEEKKKVLESDVGKFEKMIENYNKSLADLKGVLAEKEKELEVKLEDRRRYLEENEELKKKVEEQGINSRDAERMKREMQAVERDIEEMEAARFEWEDKAWGVQEDIGRQSKELDRLVMEFNQGMKRLKLGNGFQLQLNPSGSTATEILGQDYKTVLKPSLVALDEELKRSYMGKLEELISLQQQSGENVAKIEEIQRHIDAHGSQIDKIETQLSLMRKEAQEHASSCAAEAKKLSKETDLESRKMAEAEQEAAQLLKKSKALFEEEVARTDQEVEKCTQELFGLINSVSAYKENVGSKIAQMRNDLLQTAGDVANIYKASHASQG